MAFFNHVVGQLNVGERRLTEYGYTTTRLHSADAQLAVREGFLARASVANVTEAERTIRPEQAGILSVGLPAPMLRSTVLPISEEEILVGFGNASLDNSTFINRLYLFTGLTYLDHRAVSTAQLRAGHLFGIGSDEIVTLS